MRTYLFILLSGLISFSCVTPKEKLVSRIQVGMLKDEVLEVAGNPTTFARYKGKDRWIYRVVKGSDITTTEVHFLSGKAVYVGPPQTPALSAEEQDKYNEIYNRKQNETEEKIFEERRRKKGLPADGSRDDEL